MSASLVAGGLTVHFDGQAALAGVDLAVRAGEVVAVLGPSGSGKSTLLRSIAGLQSLHAGRVVLGGRDITGMPPHRRGVGLMFQDHALFPHRDVAGNVGFGLRMQGRPPGEVASRVAHLLELVDLPGYGTRRIQTLSGGEQQRVALARALAPEPAVLLLDEPFGALDRSLRDRLVVDLRSLFTRLGLTVLAVTHDQTEAFALADRVALVDGGRILQVGTPADVWGQPASRRVAELLGFANLIDISVAGGTAATPWGPVAVTAAVDGASSAVIRADRVRLSGPGAGVAGRVVASTFAGDRSVVLVEAPGAPRLEARVESSSAPAVGDEVSVVIGPDAVVLLPR